MELFFCCSLGERAGGGKTERIKAMNHELSLKVIASTQVTSVEKCSF